MKPFVYVMIGMVCLSMFSACTPTAIEATPSTVVSTGDDQSLRPDNEKD